MSELASDRVSEEQGYCSLSIYPFICSFSRPDSMPFNLEIRDAGKFGFLPQESRSCTIGEQGSLDTKEKEKKEKRRIVTP